MVRIDSIEGWVINDYKHIVTTDPHRYHRTNREIREFILNSIKPLEKSLPLREYHQLEESLFDDKGNNLGTFVFRLARRIRTKKGKGTSYKVIHLDELPIEIL